MDKGGAIMVSVHRNARSGVLPERVRACFVLEPVVLTKSSSVSPTLPSAARAHPTRRSCRPVASSSSNRDLGGAKAWAFARAATSLLPHREPKFCRPIATVEVDAPLRGQLVHDRIITVVVVETRRRANTFLLSLFAAAQRRHRLQRSRERNRREREARARGRDGQRCSTNEAV